MSLTAFLIAMIVATPSKEFKVVELNPTDDVWCYPHASDPATDDVLRVWGIEGKAVWNTGDEPDSFCIVLMRFNVKDFAGTKVKSATLTVTHADGAEFQLEWVKKAPLEVRPSNFELVEKNWAYSKVSEARPNPDPKAIFGTGAPESIPSGKPFPIAADLMKGPNKFAEYFEAATKSTTGSLNFSLTTLLDPSDLGRSAVYKFFSKDHENKAYRPVLKLELE